MDPQEPGETSFPDPPPATPLGLEYFSADAPDRRASRAVRLGLGVVAVGLLPFACGVVNLLVAAQTWSSTIAGSHRGGAMLFLGAGIVLGVVGLVRLVTLGDLSAAAVALLVVVMELAVAGCLGFAMIWR